MKWPLASDTDAVTLISSMPLLNLKASPCAAGLGLAGCCCCPCAEAANTPSTATTTRRRRFFMPWNGCRARGKSLAAAHQPIVAHTRPVRRRQGRALCSHRDRCPPGDKGPIADQGPGTTTGRGPGTADRLATRDDRLI